MHLSNRQTAHHANHASFVYFLHITDTMKRVALLLTSHRHRGHPKTSFQSINVISICFLMATDRRSGGSLFLREEKMTDFIEKGNSFVLESAGEEGGDSEAAGKSNRITPPPVTLLLVVIHCTSLYQSKEFSPHLGLQDLGL